MKIYISLSSNFQYEYAGVEAEYENVTGKKFTISTKTKFSLEKIGNSARLITDRGLLFVPAEVAEAILDMSFALKKSVELIPIDKKQKQVEIKTAVKETVVVTSATHQLLFKQEQSKEFYRHLLKNKREEALKAMEIASGRFREQVLKRVSSVEKITEDVYSKIMAKIKNEITEAKTLLGRLRKEYESFSQVYRWSYASSEEESLD